MFPGTPDRVRAPTAMSTKIYTGFAAPRLSTRAALKVLGEARPALQALVDTKHRKLLARRMASFLDRWCLQQAGLIPLPVTEAPEEPPKASRSTWWTVTEELEAEQAKCRAGHRREPLIDCDAELSLWIRPTGGRVLGMVQEERLGVRDVLIALPGFEDYAYWNNTDPDENVSSRAWRARGRAWDEVLDSETVPVLSMRLQPGFAHLEDVTPYLPSLEERLGHYATRRVQDEHLRETWTPAPGSGDLSGAMRALRKGEEALKDPESALSVRRRELIEAYRPALVADLVPWLLEPLSKVPVLSPALSPAPQDSDAPAPQPASDEGCATESPSGPAPTDAAQG